MSKSRNKKRSRVSKKKEMNKIYSQRNRRKKKEYLKTLEEKVEQLQARVEQLTDQLHRYKIKVNSMLIGDEDDFKDFKDCLEYVRTDFKTLLENSKDDEWRKQYDRVIEVLGPTGKCRQALIKHNFKAVVDNIVPDGMKYLIFLANNYTRKADMKEYDKLFKMSKESAIDALKSEDFDETDCVLYENDSSVKVKEFLDRYFEQIISLRDQMKDLFTQLLMLKDKVFDVEKQTESIYYASAIEMDALDIVSFIKGAKRLDSEGMLNLMDICNIRLKSDVHSEELALASM